MPLLSRYSGEMAIGDDEPLVAVPFPPLVTLLKGLEKQKGAALTEEEVVAARDSAICMTMALSRARAMADARGYDDIDPENAWAEWQGVRDSSL